MAMSDDGTQWTKPYEERWLGRLTVRSSRFFAVAAFIYAIGTLLAEGLDLLPWILGAVVVGILALRARHAGLWVSDVGIRLVHPVYERTFEWSSLNSVEVVSMHWMIGGWNANYLQLELKDGRRSRVPWLNTSLNLVLTNSQLHTLAAELQQRIDES